MAGIKLPERRLVSQQDRAMIQRPDVPRSKFTGAWTHKKAFSQGVLYPFLVDEILPGDHMRYEVTAFVRMATALFPMFDNLRFDTFFFFVPNRLVWENWVRFMGEQDSPADSIAFTVPQVEALSAAGFAKYGIGDHFGIPTSEQTDGSGVETVNALPFRAYNLIWHSWFRDENLQAKDADTLYKGDATKSESVYPLRVRAKSHDYFTSALPFPQKFTAPTIALSGNPLIRGIGFEPGTAWPGGGGVVNAVDPNLGTLRTFATARTTAGVGTWFDTAGGVYADMATITGITVNQLRQALMVQQLLERDSRGGTRYTELVRSHFGVTSPDARLQRPEYLGGGQTPVVLTPIAQTSPTAGVPLGALGAAGTATGSHRASYAATEHGFVIGLLNVKSELSYSQGLWKMWSRLTRYDFYWPALAGLGEQAVLRKEIYWRGTLVDDDTVFGYQERWHEYRTRVSELTGDFRGGADAAGLLEAWHVSQRFVTPPVLNSSFIGDRAPMGRVLAAGTAALEQEFLADLLIRRAAVRPIPMYGTPAGLGRF